MFSKLLAYSRWTPLAPKRSVIRPDRLSTFDDGDGSVVVESKVKIGMPDFVDLGRGSITQNDEVVVLMTAHIHAVLGSSEFHD